MRNTVSLIAEDTRTKIAENYVTSEREARFSSFHFGSFLLLVLVSLGAITVDYMIVSEFWTRALANEFLELPGTLGTSVAFKSMQVLFATIAAHILYEHMGAFGRAAFVRVVFVLSIVMLLGIGFLLALMSLPNGLAATGGGGVGSSLSAAMTSLGIASNATMQTSVTGVQLNEMFGYEPVFWLTSLGIVFLVVTGVAALCIHFAVEALRRVFHARDFKHRRRDRERLTVLEAEYDANRHALSEMEGPENRRHLLWAGLMRECRNYEHGLDEARRASKAALAPTPALRRLLGGRQRIEPMPPGFAMLDRLKNCEASRDVARYEKLFDEWWERRSRNAMKAGPATMEGVREPIGEILPSARMRLRITTEKKAAE